MGNHGVWDNDEISCIPTRIVGEGEQHTKVYRRVSSMNGGQ